MKELDYYNNMGKINGALDEIAKDIRRHKTKQLCMSPSKSHSNNTSTLWDSLGYYQTTDGCTLFDL